MERIIPPELALILAGVGLVLFSHVVRGAVFVRSSSRAIAHALELARVSPGQRVVDIGSGDGAVVIAFAKRGIETHGYEINPLLVVISKIRIRALGLQRNAHIHWADLWGIDVSPFDVVLVFGISFIMKQLEAKLHRELRPGTRVISNLFQFPTWPHVEQREHMYLYVQPSTHVK